MSTDLISLYHDDKWYHIRIWFPDTSTRSLPGTWIHCFTCIILHEHMSHHLKKTFINSKTHATWTTSSLSNHLNLLSLICSVWISLSRAERNKVMWTVFKRRKVSAGMRRLCCGTVAWGEAEDTDDTLKLTNCAESLWKRHFFSFCRATDWRRQRRRYVGQRLPAAWTCAVTMLLVWVRRYRMKEVNWDKLYLLPSGRGSYAMVSEF